MPATVQYDPAEECYWQGTFLLQQRGGKEEVNELEYKPDFFLSLFHPHLSCPYFPTSPFSLLLEVLQIV